MYVCMYACMYACMYICMNVCVIDFDMVIEKRKTSLIEFNLPHCHHVVLWNVLLLTVIDLE